MPKSKPRADQILLGSIVALQLVFSGFFIFDLGADVLGWRNIAMSWQFHEAVQIITILALLLGAALGVIAYRNLARQRKEMGRKVLVAQNAFHELIEQNFKEWGLTPSEHDVGMLILKGLSNTEIAEMRGKSIGTIKAQVNAVFRKAGANGRTQLISMFMLDLMAD